MPGPKELKQKEAEIEAQVTVPRLSAKETERRAKAGFDIAVNAVIKQYFSKPPPKEEINAITGMVAERAASGEVDLSSVLDEYSKNNPGSLIAKYYRKSGDDGSWMLSGNSIKFGLAKLQKSIKESFNAAKEPFAKVVVILSNPENRGIDLNMQELAAVMPEETKELQNQLSQQFGKGKNQLPLTMSYDEDEAKIVFASTLKPPAQQIAFE